MYDEFNENDNLITEFDEEWDNTPEDIEIPEDEDLNPEDYEKYYTEVYISGKLSIDEDPENFRITEEVYEDIGIPVETEDNKILLGKDVNFLIEPSKEEDRQTAILSKESEENVRKLYVGVKEWVVDCVKEGVQGLYNLSPEKERVRKYNKQVSMPKIVHPKPYEPKSFATKLVFFTLACLAVGVFLGIKANSYYTARANPQLTPVKCALLWLTEENLPYTFFPIKSEVFGTAFLIGVGISAFIGLIIWIDSNVRKQSRVGHEHGQARLATRKDFKVYKQRFME